LFSQNKKITFLFGSGLSIPVKMPSTEEITKLVLSGQGIYRHSTGHYDFGKPLYQQPVDLCVSLIVEFLNNLYKEILTFYDEYKFKAKTNYEDLYNITEQISDNLLGEYENPLIQYFIDNVINNDQKFAIPLSYSNKYFRNRTLIDLLSESLNYLHYVVYQYIKRRHLQIQLQNLAYLEFLYDCYKDTNIKSLQIFTLNYDRVLDIYFKDKNMKYTDGFEPIGQYLDIWDKNSFNKNQLKINLYKLHGSIKWFSADLSFLGLKNVVTKPKHLSDDILVTDETGGPMFDINGYPLMYIIGEILKY